MDLHSGFCLSGIRLIGCYNSRNLMMGGGWGLLLLYADLHLIPWMVPLPCLQWLVPWLPKSRVSSPSCPDDKPPVFCWGSDQSCLTSASLMLTPSEETWVSNSWGLEGTPKWLVLCSTQCSPSKSVTTHLPKFGDIFDLLSLFLLLFPWELCCSLIVSLRGGIA